MIGKAKFNRPLLDEVNPFEFSISIFLQVYLHLFKKQQYDFHIELRKEDNY